MTTETKGKWTNVLELFLTFKGVKRRRKFVGCSPLDHFDIGEKVGVGTFG